VTGLWSFENFLPKGLILTAVNGKFLFEGSARSAQVKSASQELPRVEPGCDELWEKLKE
jgi:hypothetical protein